MDAVLQEHFSRVEAALGTLVDSIASYNPSPQAAVDLVAADDELSRGLDQLAQHQANHSRIQALRAEADALEEQLRSSVSTLASLRHDLFETSVATLPEDSRPVPFEELLQYAKNIAKYTVPPTYRERIPIPHPQDREGEDGGSSGAASNGMSTPALPPPSATTQEAPKDLEGTKEGDSESPKDITAEEAEWLKKLNESQMGWFPWPNNDKIRRGNLMKIQWLLDTGKNPALIDIEQLAEEEKRKMEDEVEKNAENAAAAQALQAPEARQAPQVRRESAAAPHVSPVTEQPQQAQFSGFDFAEDEEEDY